MWRCVAILLVVSLLGGEGQAGTVNASVNTVRSGPPVDTNIVFPTFPLFGQTFTVNTVDDQPYTVTDFSFYLDTQRHTFNVFNTLSFDAYIGVWASGGNLELTAINAVTSPVSGGAISDGTHTWDEYNVQAGGVQLQSNTEYVAFFGSSVSSPYNANIGKESTSWTDPNDPGAEVVLGRGVIGSWGRNNPENLYDFNDANIDYDLAFKLSLVLPDGNGSGGGGAADNSPEPASCLMWAFLGCSGAVYTWRRRRRK